MPLNFKQKTNKRNETFYLDNDTIEFVTAEAEAYGQSKNNTLAAIVAFYREEKAKKLARKKGKKI